MLGVASRGAGWWLHRFDRSRGYVIPELEFPEELMDQFRHYDSDGDGQISPSEFVDLITEVRECYS